MKYKKPNMICYRIAQLVSWLVATLIFRRKYIRNEIRGKKGAFVVIANHEAALDFVDIMQSRGYQFVTVEELLEINGVDISEGLLYRKGDGSEVFLQ